MAYYIQNSNLGWMAGSVRYSIEVCNVKHDKRYHILNELQNHCLNKLVKVIVCNAFVIVLYFIRLDY